MSNLPPRPEDHRRTMIFFVLAMLVLGLSYVFITKPQLDRVRNEQSKAKAEALAHAPEIGLNGSNLTPDPLTVEKLLKQGQRLQVETPKLDGSLSLQGLRIDDMQLKNYYTTLEKDQRVRLLAPKGAAKSFFTEIGLMPVDKATAVPDENTVWKVVSGKELSQKSPVVMEWDNGAGLVFTRTLAIDTRYVLTVTQDVKNNTAKDVTLYPYALVSETHAPHVKGEQVSFEEQASSVQHLGPIGYFDGKLHEESYEDVKDEDNGTLSYKNSAGWLGITTKYWLVALLPEKDSRFDARFVYQKNAANQEVYQTDMRSQALTVEAGKSASSSLHVFVGAKKLSILQDYQDSLNVPKLELAIDFGVLYFLTKPIYMLLSYMGNYFHDQFGMVVSFGLALLLLTVLLRALTFPLQNKSYRSMNKMKDLAPKMQDLKEKYGNDKPKFQEEVMALYKREKINPASGCLPILLQIPIFFALYKVIYITLDMRHAPFWGWIHDLSAPDPTNVFNLFGLLPWHPPAFLAIGVWPILYGLTMSIQQSLNPKPEDQTQQQVFAILPWVFMFIFAKFPAGLVIYYTWSNLLGIVQQYSLRKLNPAIAAANAPHKRKKHVKHEPKTD